MFSDQRFPAVAIPKNPGAITLILSRRFSMEKLVSVKIRLLKLGKTTKWLADRLQIKPSTLYGYLNGFTTTPAELKNRIENVIAAEEQNLTTN